ncbi:nucleotide pyrophosphohydrolase [Microbacterium sp. A196]|uniref:nucleotide pyrophosphohydrolase n=1 Tax=Microbacterium sp. A196 TaxID=3457320 RepID=UPI003FD11F31
MPTPATLATLRAFVVERDWDQFHSPENLAKSISIEAAELLELYQWGQQPNQARVEEELADVLTYCFQLATKLGVDIDEIVLNKLEKTRVKYPVELSKGSVNRYADLHGNAES